MDNNLELNKPISFDELIEHGKENGANMVGDMPWSWDINGYPVTHENDQLYIIGTETGPKYMRPDDYLIATPEGLRILTPKI